MENLTAHDTFAQQRVNTVYLAEIDHPDGLLHLWNDYGILYHDEIEWSGLGLLCQLSIPPDTGQTGIQEITFGLAGVDPEAIAGINSKVRGRKAKVWRGVLTPDRQILHQELIADAELSHQVYKVEDSGTATITIVGLSGFYNMRNQSSALIDKEDHVHFLVSVGIDPASDTGYDRVATISDEPIEWGPE